MQVHVSDNLAADKKFFSERQPKVAAYLLRLLDWANQHVV
jgi:hypothetical protein